MPEENFYLVSLAFSIDVIVPVVADPAVVQHVTRNGEFLIAHLVDCCWILAISDSTNFELGDEIATSILIIDD